MVRLFRRCRFRIEGHDKAARFVSAPYAFLHRRFLQGRIVAVSTEDDKQN